MKARVVGVGEGDRAVAVSRDLLAETGVQHVTLGRDQVVLWHVPGQVSALDTQVIPDGAEIWSVAAFAARAGGGRPLVGYGSAMTGTPHDHDQDSEPSTSDGESPDSSPSPLDREPGAHPDPDPEGADDTP